MPRSSTVADWLLSTQWRARACYKEFLADLLLLMVAMELKRTEEVEVVKSSMGKGPGAARLGLNGGEV